MLFVPILFGIGLILVGDRRKPFLNILESAHFAIFRVVDILMKAAPVGAFACTIGKYGIASVMNLAMLVGRSYLTSAMFGIVILGSVCLADGCSIFKLISYLKAELLLVLGTSSSELALPLLESRLRAARGRPGRSNRLRF